MPNFVVCPEFTGRFGAADEAGTVKIMGSSTDLYLAKKILTKWHAKATQQPSDKVKWWLAFVEEKGIQPVTVSARARQRANGCDASSQMPQLTNSAAPSQSHDILDGLARERWVEYVATYNKAVAARLQKDYHARKKAAAIKAKQQDHRAARSLVGLGGAGPSASRS